MTKVAFRQVDLTRAIRAAKDAGMEVGACEILPDARIVIRERASASVTEDAFGAWKAKREGRVEGRS